MKLYLSNDLLKNTILFVGHNYSIYFTNLKKERNVSTYIIMTAINQSNVNVTFGQKEKNNYIYALLLGYFGISLVTGGINLILSLFGIFTFMWQFMQLALTCLYYCTISKLGCRVAGKPLSNASNILIFLIPLEILRICLYQVNILYPILVLAIVCLKIILFTSLSNEIEHKKFCLLCVLMFLSEFIPLQIPKNLCQLVISLICFVFLFKYNAKIPTELKNSLKKYLIFIEGAVIIASFIQIILFSILGMKTTSLTLSNLSNIETEEGSQSQEYELNLDTNNLILLNGPYKERNTLTAIYQNSKLVDEIIEFINNIMPVKNQTDYYMLYGYDGSFLNKNEIQTADYVINQNGLTIWAHLIKTKADQKDTCIAVNSTDKNDTGLLKYIPEDQEYDSYVYDASLINFLTAYPENIKTASKICLLVAGLLSLILVAVFHRFSYKI